MNSFKNLYSCSWDEIIENKVELRNLKRDAKSLEYISICEREGVEDFLIAHFVFEYPRKELRKEFEKYTGLSLTNGLHGLLILRAYNEALKKEIDSLK